MNMFGKELIMELKKQKIFESYWNNEIENTLNEEIILDYEPTDNIGFYKCVKEFELPYQGNIDELVSSVAFLSLTFTSTEESFDLDNAMERTKSKDVVSAINAKIEVYYEKEKILVYMFRLWSGKPAKIESNTIAIKLLLGAL